MWLLVGHPADIFPTVNKWSTHIWNSVLNGALELDCLG